MNKIGADKSTTRLFAGDDLREESAARTWAGIPRS